MKINVYTHIHIYIYYILCTFGKKRFVSGGFNPFETSKYREIQSNIRKMCSFSMEICQARSYFAGVWCKLLFTSKIAEDDNGISLTVILQRFPPGGSLSTFALRDVQKKRIPIQSCSANQM